MLRKGAGSGSSIGAVAAAPLPPLLNAPVWAERRGRAISTTFNCFRNVVTGMRTFPALGLDEPEVTILFDRVEPADFRQDGLE